MAVPAADVSAKQESLVWKLLVLTALTYLVWSDKVSISFSPFGEGVVEQVSARRTSASLFGLASTALATNQEPVAKRVAVPAGPLHNSTLAIDPAFALRNRVPAPVSTANP